MPAMNNQKFKLKLNSNKILKYLEINPTKDVWHLYMKNYKASLRKIKEYLNQRKDGQCSWVRRLNIVKRSIFLKMF